MNGFDYDEAERQFHLCRDPKPLATPEEPHNQQATTSTPHLHLVHSFAGIRMLPRPRQHDLSLNLQDVTGLLQDKYQMHEPDNDQRDNYDLWTSNLFRETFAIKEFPKKFWKAGGGKYRFRKHYWGVTGSLASANKYDGPGLFPAVFKEMSSLRAIGHHQNIVGLMDIFFLGSRPSDLAVVLVFQGWGYSLKEVLSFPEANCRMEANPPMKNLIFKQLLTGLEYIHSHGIIHRNVTSTSVKVDETGRVRIGNFSYAIPAGITVKAAPFPEEDFPLVHPDTYDHLAPEILLGSNQYEKSSDIWSVGLIFVEVHRRQMLYDLVGPLAGDAEAPKPTLTDCRYSSLSVILKIFRILGTPTEETFPDFWKFPFFHFNFPKWSRTFEQVLVDFPADLRNLAAQMLQYCPSRRPSARSLLKSL